MIGDPAMRNRGTAGGSVANFDPAADYPAALLAVNGAIEANRRSIAATDFFLGLFETAPEDGEIVKWLTLPIPRRAGWETFANPASRYAMAAVLVADLDGEPGIGVTGAGQTALAARRRSRTRCEHKASCPKRSTASASTRAR